MTRLPISCEHSSRWKCRHERYHGAPWSPSEHMVAFLFLIMMANECEVVNGFVPFRHQYAHHATMRTAISNDDNVSTYFDEDFGGDETDGQIIPDLDWRIAKAKLEEAHTQRFLKSRARFLPYAECRKWAIATDRFDCEQDWKEFVSLGEGLNTYIPSAPDEYYSRLGQWISWEHFLGKCSDVSGLGSFD